MSEPTSALSFYDLILRVAREAGIAYYGSVGNEAAMIPVDVHDIDLCRQIVNDGIRMFIADAPPKGWRWMRRIMSVSLTATRITGTVDAIGTGTIADATLEELLDDDGDPVYVDDYFEDWYVYVLTGTGAGSYAQVTDYEEDLGVITVADWLDAQGNPGGTDPAIGDTFAITPIETVGGNITRYPLAENFGGEVDGPIEYEADSTHGTNIEWCDESRIRARQSVDTHIGYPKLAAIRPLEYKSGGFGPKRRFELIVDPQPSAAEVVEFPYTLFFDKLRMVAGLATNGAAAAISNSALAKIYPDDLYDGWKISVISGTGKGATAIVTSYVGADGEFFVDDWLYSDDTAAAVNPASGSAYYAEPRANLHPAGFRFDQAILAACLAQAEIDIEDVASGFVQKYMKKALPNAHRIDIRSAPKKLGSMNLQRREYYGRRGGRSDITTDHDI